MISRIIIYGGDSIHVLTFYDEQNRIHRIHGPATIIDRCHEWYFHGKRHLIDGPAIVNYNRIHYYIHGKEIKK